MKPAFRVDWPLSIAASLVASIVLFVLLNAHAIIPFLVLAAVFWLLATRYTVIIRYTQLLLTKVHQFLNRYL